MSCLVGPNTSPDRVLEALRPATTFHPQRTRTDELTRRLHGFRRLPPWNVAVTRATSLTPQSPLLCTQQHVHEHLKSGEISRSRGTDLPDCQRSRFRREIAFGGPLDVRSRASLHQCGKRDTSHAAQRQEPRRQSSATLKGTPLVILTSSSKEVANT